MRGFPTQAFRVGLVLIPMFVGCGLVVWNAPGAQVHAADHTPRANRLAREGSPYLQQHLDNPIWWYPWGKEALRAAKDGNKPIFLSIGYSSCHWCHVMSGDTFSNPQVAELLNAHFIAILVDREERPDVDHTYLRAFEALSGKSGWPISIFLTPNGKPFAGATFIPSKRFIALLTQIQRMWGNHPGRINEIARRAVQILRNQADVAYGGESLPDESILSHYYPYPLTIITTGVAALAEGKNRSS